MGLVGSVAPVASRVRRVGDAGIREDPESLLGMGLSSLDSGRAALGWKQ